MLFDCSPWSLVSSFSGGWTVDSYHAPLEISHHFRGPNTLCTSAPTLWAIHFVPSGFVPKLLLTKGFSPLPSSHGMMLLCMAHSHCVLSFTSVLLPPGSVPDCLEQLNSLFSFLVHHRSIRRWGSCLSVSPVQHGQGYNQYSINTPLALRIIYRQYATGGVSSNKFGSYEVMNSFQPQVEETNKSTERWQHSALLTQVNRGCLKVTGSRQVKVVSTDFSKRQHSTNIMSFKTDKTLGCNFHLNSTVVFWGSSYAYFKRATQGCSE